VPISRQFHDFSLGVFLKQLTTVMFIHCSNEINCMPRSAKAVATLASLAALACFMFAIGWVGLALLGY
jgi:hypothetical protein